MAQSEKNKIAWTVVITGLIVAVGGAFVTNFVILPIRDKMKARDAQAMTVHDLCARVERIESWQKDMQRWKERMIASTGTIGMRTAIGSMPSPQPIDTTH
jgi:hypothetical protein